MIMFFTTWFLGSFLYSKSLDTDVWGRKGNDNISIWPPIFFIAWITTAMLVIFSEGQNVDWSNGYLFNSIETVPWTFLGLSAFVVGDFMFSKVTFFILKDVITEISQMIKAIYERIYFFERPALLRYRQQAEQRRKEASF
tara:strand:+ start:40 stop:459 length:420 start_codon:yes stop_codon:yes gene_type:complete